MMPDSYGGRGWSQTLEELHDTLVMRAEIASKVVVDYVHSRPPVLYRNVSISTRESRRSWHSFAARTPLSEHHPYRMRLSSSS